MNRTKKFRSGGAGGKRKMGFIPSNFQDSSVQGFKFICSPQLTTVERVYWIVAVLACVLISGYLIYIVYIKYLKIPVIISFQPQETSIRQIPFPAITFCNINIFRKSVLNKMISEFLEAFNNSPDPNNDPVVFEYISVLEHLAQFCQATSSFRRDTGQKICDVNGGPDSLQALHEKLALMNVSSISFFEHDANASKIAKQKLDDTYRRAVTNCKNTILKCVWSGKQVPCSDIFFPLDTEQGRCCTFNMMPRFLLQNISGVDQRAMFEGKKLPDRMIEEWKKFKLDEMVRTNPNLEVTDFAFPQYQAAGGQPYGLSVIINPDLTEYSTCTTNDGLGFMMKAHSSLSIPNVMEYGAAIPPSSEVYVEIDPEVTDADYQEMEQVDIVHRECYLPSDEESQLEHFNVYTASNCEMECSAYHIFHNCTCLPPLLPRNSTQSLCGARERQCVEEVIFNLVVAKREKDLCARCRPSCTDIQYKMSVNDFDLREEVTKTPINFKSSKGLDKSASNYTIIHIFFGSDTFYMNQRKSLYSIKDLFGDAGSLLGVTLGISIVSFIEFLYFCTFRLYYHCQSKRIKPVIGYLK